MGTDEVGRASRSERTVVCGARARARGTTTHVTVGARVRCNTGGLPRARSSETYK